MYPAIFLIFVSLIFVPTCADDANPFSQLVTLITDLNDALGKDGFDFQKLAKVTAKLGPVLKLLGPVGMAMDIFSIFSKESDKKHQEIMNQFREINSKLDDIDKKIDGLSSQIDLVASFQTYKDNVFLPLRALRNTHYLYSRSPDQYNRDEFRRACQQEKNPSYIISHINALLIEDNHGARLMESTFNAVSYDRKKFHAYTYAMTDIVEAGVLWQFCMIESLIKPKNKSMENAAELVKNVTKNIETNLQKYDKKLVKDWSSVQLKKDIEERMKLAAATKPTPKTNEQLADDILTNLNNKYFWVRFRVLVFDHLDYATYRTAQAEFVRENTGEKGLVSVSDDKKTVTVIWTSKNAAAAAESRKSELQQAFDNWTKNNTIAGCRGGSAGANLDNLQAYEKVKNLPPQVIYVVGLPYGGDYYALSRNWSTKNLAVRGDDGSSVTGQCTGAAMVNTAGSPSSKHQVDAYIVLGI